VSNAAELTDRELITMKLVVRGLANKAISKELWVTEQTVKFHLTNIYRKLGVANRTEAARWAFRHGLLTESDDATARPELQGPSRLGSEPEQHSRGRRCAKDEQKEGSRIGVAVCCSVPA
jgi:DNA-binding CsgD family transcriptional regulator